MYIYICIYIYIDTYIYTYIYILLFFVFMRASSADHDDDDAQSLGPNTQIGNTEEEVHLHKRATHEQSIRKGDQGQSLTPSLDGVIASRVEKST